MIVTAVKEINFMSINANGLSDVTKRRMLFKSLKKYRSSVFCIQETHLKESLLPVIKCQWGCNGVILSGDASNMCGVAILLSRDLDAEITVLEKDRVGRFIMVRLKINGVEWILVNVYFPTSNYERAQIQLLEDISVKLEQYEGESFIFLGDFNVCLDTKLDRYNHTAVEIRNPAFRQNLLSFLDNFSLCDVWRLRNANNKLFTWFRGARASRLDYIFVPNCISGMVSSFGCTDISLSDHRLISVSLGEKPDKRGPGLWKLDVGLLERDAVVEEISTLIKSLEVETQGQNPQESWEFLKFKVREKFISIKSRINKERNEEINFLRKEIKRLVGQEDLDELEVELLSQFRRELYSLERHEEYKCYLRSKCNWARFGEKSSKFFLNLEKNNQQDRVITQLFDDKGDLLSDSKKILEFQRSHFQDRYKRSVDGDLDHDEFSSLEGAEIDDLERDIIEDEFTVRDLEAALKTMKAGKSPGPDGLPAEFYRRFWPIIGNWLLKSFLSSFEKGRLSTEQYRGAVTLIPKKNKDKRFIDGWRPITLLNLDYKILAKCLALRIRDVIPKLIDLDQSGFVYGRYIGVNLRNTQDVISHFLGEEEGGLVVSVDFAAAFDTLDRHFLLRALRSFKFGRNFCQWVEILYREACGCVMNNGFSSDWFTLEAGLRQGCPLSPWLFILAVEKLAHKIRNDDRIQGAEINGNSHKVSQYADDTTLFLKNSTSLERAFEILDEFAGCAGLKVNINKTQGLQVNFNAELGEIGSQLKWKDSISILGLEFDKAPEDELRNLNYFDKYLAKMQEICSTWSKRSISLKGKVVILNTLIYPIIYYAATNSLCPQNIFPRVRNMSQQFLWCGGNSKIAFDTLTLPTSQGGLGLHDFADRIKAARLIWVTRILSIGSGPMRDFLLSSCKVKSLTDIFMRKCYTYPEGLQGFYKQLYYEWQRVYNIIPSTDWACRCEPLWHNRNISMGFLVKEKERWLELGLRRVNDIVFRGKIMTPYRFRQKYDITPPPKVFNRLNKAVPANILNGMSPLQREIEGQGLYIVDSKGSQVDAGLLSAKDFYLILSKKKTRKVAAKIKWAQILDTFEEAQLEGSWSYWFSLPYKVSREVRLQSFQYKVLHRTLPCGVFLEKLKIRASDKCMFCDGRDDIIHFLYQCPNTCNFWQSVSHWLLNNSELVHLPRQLEVTDFLFGIRGEDHSEKRVNFILLLGRFYVYRQKLFHQGVLDVYAFLVELKHTLSLERMACLKENSYNKKFKIWEEFFDEL